MIRVSKGYRDCITMAATDPVSGNQLIVSEAITAWHYSYAHEILLSLLYNAH